MEFIFQLHLLMKIKWNKSYMTDSIETMMHTWESASKSSNSSVQNSSTQADALLNQNLWTIHPFSHVDGWFNKQDQFMKLKWMVKLKWLMNWWRTSYDCSWWHWQQYYNTTYAKRERSHKTHFTRHFLVIVNRLTIAFSCSMIIIHGTEHNFSYFLCIVKVLNVY